MNLQQIKDEAYLLSTKIDEATGKLVKYRLEHDTYKARNAEIGLMSLASASQQFLSYLIGQIEKEEIK